jgi:hypothetical protein
MKSLRFSAALLLFMASFGLRAGEPKALDESFIEILRVVEDKDGTTNVRAAASLDAKVSGKVTSGAVVSVFPGKGDWTEIDAGGDQYGDQFIHSSRLKKLDGWKQVSAAKSDGDEKGIVSHSGAEVTVTSAKFAEKDHKVSKNKEGALLVDGHHPWGTDGSVPTRSLSLTVTLNEKSVTIPPTATADLFEPDMSQLFLLTPGDPAKQMVVAMWNSDGAGGYLVAWSFVNGRYAGRTVMAP